MDDADEDPESDLPKLLKGSHPTVVHENVRTLMRTGKSMPHATRIAMRHAKTGRFVKHVPRPKA